MELDIACQRAEAWKNEKKELDKELNELYTQMAEDIHRYMDEIEIETDKATMPEYHKGKGVEDVSACQARRTMNKFKTYSGNVLWFAESFGLIPKALELEMKKSGRKKIICLNDDKENQCTADKSKDDKQDLLQILFLLDKFGIGDAFYHELSMAHPELPRSYRRS